MLDGERFGAVDPPSEKTDNEVARVFSLRGT